MARHSTRPGGTMPRTTIDASEAMTDAASEAVEKAMHKAAVLAYQLFGQEVEPYVGAEEQAAYYPRWQRIFVDVDGCPPLNYLAPSNRDEVPSFTVGITCPECGSWVARGAESILELALIREAPGISCRRCRDLGRLTLVSVWP